MAKRTRVKRIRKIGRVRKGPLTVTHAEFNAVIKLMNERGEFVNELRRELHAICRDLSSQVEKNRRTLEIQFTRMAQLQQEIDEIKRKVERG